MEGNPWDSIQEHTGRNRIDTLVDVMEGSKKHWGLLHTMIKIIMRAIEEEERKVQSQ